MIQGQIRSTVPFVPPVDVQEEQFFKGTALIMGVRIYSDGGYIVIAKHLIPELIQVLRSYVVEDDH